MEEKINIAEILKDKPKGIRLYSPIFGECAFSFVREETDEICVKKHNGEKAFFNSKGLYNILGECLLFPSKKMRDWSKFVWKKGDVLVGKYNVYIIFEGFTEDTYIRFNGKHYLCKECGEEDYSKKEVQMLTSFFKKANDDEAQTYINTIEERLGGKLNLETLEIEKQPEFKDGDIVAVDLQRKNIRIFKEKVNENNHCLGKYYIGFSFNYEGKPIQIFEDYRADCELDRLATDTEKQQLFDALAKEGKAFDAEKKQIVDLKPKWTPKPFDRVITRTPDTTWTANFFSHIDSDGIKNCIDDRYIMCLPYNDETAKLIGTTNNWRG